MMGHGHALSGAAIWVLGCGIAEANGARPSFASVVVGAGVCAGAALIPDLDHPNSTISRSAGLVSRAIALVLGRFGAVIHALTKTRWDRDDLDGHRTITHTVLWAALSGGTVTILQIYAAPWVAAALVLYMTGLGLKTVSPRGRRPAALRVRVRRFLRRPRLSLPATCALIAAFTAYQLTPRAGWWLGLAVAVGSLLHCLGDCLTNSACPLLWPIPIGPAGRRRRWYPVGPPPRFRFSAGDRVETRLVYPVLIVLLAVGLLLVTWPVMQPVVTAFVEAF